MANKALLVICLFVLELLDMTVSAKKVKGEYFSISIEQRNENKLNITFH